MPIVLSERDYLTLKAHLKEAQQEIRNLKSRIAGISRKHRGARVAKQGVRFYNDSGETIPAYGVMRITGSSTSGYLTVSKPNTSFNALYLVNGPRTVAYQAYSRGSFLMGDSASMLDRRALYNTAATPLAGESWGVINNSWLLHQHGPGFGILGGPDGTTVSVIQIPPAEILVKRTAGSLAAGSSGEFEVHVGVSGSESDSGQRVTALNKMSVAFGDEKYGAVGIMNGQTYAVRFQE